MFAFLRKYQRYFFLIVSIVVIVSFSFFGTYNALTTDNTRDLLAFKAVDGTKISRAEMNEMILFLSTDTDDKALFGGLWGPNFLNDGVIRKDLLQTGLATVIASNFAPDLETDLIPRLQVEKKYTPYKHPEAGAISTETVWGYAAPEIKKNFDILRKGNNPLDPASFNARVRLYLNERRLPQQYLRQLLRYQEQQYAWVKPDPTLDRTDLSLFGYHTLNDWFGPRFISLAAEFIINAAKTAEKQGYYVSPEEALTDLNRNSMLSFEQNLRSPNLGVTNSNEYFNEQLRIMNLDQRMAVKIWQNVMLFRRLFHEAGESVFMDPSTFSNFITFTKENVSGDTYQLPKELKLGDYKALQKLELYLEAVSKSYEKGSLALPTQFKSSNEVKQKYPELVQKRYLVEISEINKSALQNKVALKETWSWEIDDSNWNTLKKQFPDLGVKAGNTREERLEALDNLDKGTRSKIDAFARKAIVEAHPEWITQALDSSEVQKKEISLSAKQASEAFKGLKDATPLMTLLDNAQIGVVDDKLSAYTADQNNFYNIAVIAKTPQEEVISFAEANKNGALNKLLDKQLKSFYEQNREANAAKFQQKDNSWKPFEEVKDQVADLYFAKTLQTLKKESGRDSITGENGAPLRFQSYVKKIRDAAEKDPASIDAFVRVAPMPTPEGQLSDPVILSEQWKLEKVPFKFDRSSSDESVDVTALIAGNDWADVKSTPTGAVFFYHKAASQLNEDRAALNAKTDRARQQLSNAAQCTLGQRCTDEWKAKNALSLEFLQPTPEMTEDKVQD